MKTQEEVKKEYSKQYREANKEKTKKYSKEWREANKEKVKKYYEDNKEIFKQKRKKYYEDNKDGEKERARKYYEANKEKNKEYKKKYRHANKEEIKEYNKKWREENKEYNKKYRKSNKEKKKEYNKKYREDNKERINDYQRNRIKTDALFKMTRNLRGRTIKAFKSKGYKKSSKTQKMLGVDWEVCKQHIEKQFTKGMNWSNQGDWHIDHIIPLASANNEKDLMKLCYYRNLQPLWAEDNLIKSAKILGQQSFMRL